MLCKLVMHFLIFASGLFTLLDMSFLLQRSLGYYLIQLYLPCIFLVMLSWLVFWMSPESGGDRLTVGITCILTIVFLLGYVNGMLPKVFSSILTVFSFFYPHLLASKLSIWYDEQSEPRERCLARASPFAWLLSTPTNGELAHRLYPLWRWFRRHVIESAHFEKPLLFSPRQKRAPVFCHFQPSGFLSSHSYVERKAQLKGIKRLRLRLFQAKFKGKALNVSDLSASG